MGAESEPLAATLDSATSAMLLELTTGRERMAAGYERFARLSEMYVSHAISRGLNKALSPQDSLESFKGWCSWMLADRERAQEFEMAMRQAADYLKGTHRPAYASDPSVQRIVRGDFRPTDRTPPNADLDTQSKYAGHQRSKRFKRHGYAMMD